jgi:hypothetical protein
MCLLNPTGKSVGIWIHFLFARVKKIKNPKKRILSCQRVWNGIWKIGQYGKYNNLP